MINHLAAMSTNWFSGLWWLGFYMSIASGFVYGAILCYNHPSKGLVKYVNFFRFAVGGTIIVPIYYTMAPPMFILYAMNLIEIKRDAKQGIWMSKRLF